MTPFLFTLGGFLYVDVLLQMSHFADYSFVDLKRVVDANDKKRFLIQEEASTGRAQIRANQGHSIKVRCDWLRVYL